MFPSREQPTWTARCVLDRVRVLATGVLLAAAAVVAGGGGWTVCCVVLVPIVVLTWVIGFVVYLNHTHPDVVWFIDRHHWTHLAGQIDATIDVRFRPPLAWLVGNIMHHPAHHLHPGVPLVNLAAAQDRLNEIPPITRGNRDLELSATHGDRAHVQAVRL